MTNDNAIESLPYQRTGRYRLIRDKDGVDNTFEVESAFGRHRIAWAGYWEEEARARRAASNVAAFLDAVANYEVELDMGELVEELIRIAARWGFQELRQARPDWSDAKVWNYVREYRYFHGNDVGYPAGLVKFAYELDS